jgi:hypothetical protein
VKHAAPHSLKSDLSMQQSMKAFAPPQIPKFRRRFCREYEQGSKKFLKPKAFLFTLGDLRELRSQ